MKATESEVIKVQHQSSLYNNRLFSSAQNVQDRQKKYIQKNSDRSLIKQRKQSISQIRENIQQDLIGHKYQTDTKLLSKKKMSSQSNNNNENFYPPTNNEIPLNQQQEIKQRLQQDYKRDYLANKVTPTLNKMLVKIINHKPNDILGFMINFLKSEQEKFQKKRFNDKPPNDAIKENKHFQEIFSSTVASKFIKFKN